MGSSLLEFKTPNLVKCSEKYPSSAVRQERHRQQKTDSTIKERGKHVSCRRKELLFPPNTVVFRKILKFCSRWSSRDGKRKTQMQLSGPSSINSQVKPKHLPPCQSKKMGPSFQMLRPADGRKRVNPRLAGAPAAARTIPQKAGFLRA